MPAQFLQTLLAQQGIDQLSGHFFRQCRALELDQDAVDPVGGRDTHLDVQIRDTHGPSFLEVGQHVGDAHGPTFLRGVDLGGWQVFLRHSVPRTENSEHRTQETGVRRQEIGERKKPGLLSFLILAPVYCLLTPIKAHGSQLIAQKLRRYGSQSVISLLLPFATPAGSWPGPGRLCIP